MISELGLDSNEFGLHSLRSGGASQAARSGVSGRVWRRHGGWRSIQAADGYVDESLDNTLVVSRNLALQFSVCDLLDKHCANCVVCCSMEGFTFAQLILMA